MPEAVFYVLATQSQAERMEFACKLIEKIYRGGQHCYVLTDSPEQASHFDKLLWTFRAGSFIPHQIYNGVIPTLRQTILIGGGDIPGDWRNLLVNLSNITPQINPETGRILEILDNSEPCKHAGRQRYRYYQELKFTLKTHKI